MTETALIVVVVCTPAAMDQMYTNKSIAAFRLVRQPEVHGPALN